MPGSVANLDDAILADTLHFLKRRLQELQREEMVQSRPPFYDELHAWHKRQFQLILDLT